MPVTFSLLSYCIDFNEISYGDDLILQEAI